MQRAWFAKGGLQQSRFAEYLNYASRDLGQLKKNLCIDCCKTWQTVRLLHIKPGFTGESTVLKPPVNGGDRGHIVGAVPLTLVHYIEL